jgi:hypothetical protein
MERAVRDNMLMLRWGRLLKDFGVDIGRVA